MVTQLSIILKLNGVISREVNFKTLQHSNWSSSNFLDDSQRDVILVDNTNEIGKWTTGFSNSADQYYSIIQYDSSSAANQNYKILSDGTVMWFYQDTDNIGNIDIWSQRIDLKTGETSTPQLVNNITTGTQFKPTVYEFNDGNFVVGWLTDFGVAYQYFDENGNEVGDEGSFQSTTADFPESLSISPLDADLVYYDYSGYSINNSSGQSYLPDNFEVPEQPDANDFQITLNNNETFYKYDEVSQTFTNSISAKLSGVDEV